MAGCAAATSEDTKRIEIAAAMAAVTKVKKNLPPWPDYCRKEMPGVVPKVGEPVWGTQARWDVVRDQENTRIDWCSKHYDGLSNDFGESVP